MHQLQKTALGTIFLGSVETEADLEAAANLATHCHEYQEDVEDEAYFNGSKTCFDCRFRRWLSGGFSCLKNFPGTSHNK
ncbi:hypothetical protein JWJ90_20910 [Desulfobulbus rhabdoformis]|jgi:hypothetical protein|uniref:hypothetical protein n=1 Tax=Desulfobulbus rhabdoformis TaxID=34032 RepID=UPI0019625E2C|nr:hypothetical protein [Desulfobulbus rhabdoformis]MBM9616728.1 hypothetical protein [Desulfobulbus rhabdoformis]